MSASILVAYATRYGSTQEVAQTIVEILQKEGFKVDLVPARKVNSLDGYMAVVLGAPLYMFRWHNDARHFLSQHQIALTTIPIPIAVFALGPFHDKEEELQSARAQLNKELFKYPWLEPASIEVFAGKFDPDSLRFPYNLIGPLKKLPASDERDWTAIRSWAGNLPGLLKVK